VPEAATAVYVCYGTTSLDLSWIPGTVEVLIVHNDGLLAEDSCDHPRVRHLYPGGNIGFGAGVNLALPEVEGSRLVIVNPDTTLSAAHWDALAAGTPDEIVVVRLIDSSGRPTSPVNRYPSPLVALLTGFRAGRLMPRGSRRRILFSRLLPGWGKDHAAFMTTDTGTWDLRTYWAAAPLISMATDRVRAVAGFDAAYFLYMEDVDFCRRLGHAYPGMQIRMASSPPGIHAVGGSVDAIGAAARDLRYLSSISTYASRQRGWAWRLAGAGLACRKMWLEARSRPASGEGFAA
jgi:N-acetylglucosaminyl-diphospho-decaprenol L-rhamnosyltransferase